jgi:anionic cell wall polymer biosynthesis LytR-Cps2A-Psr (LCP) family protein
MKKLVIAVIVLSFFGFGPLKSFFQSGTENDGEGKKSISIFEKLKDSSKSEEKVETFLVMEKSTEPTSSNSEPGMLLKYDKANNKIKYATILVPTIEPEAEMDKLKSLVKEIYKMDIDFCFIFDTSGIGTVIDILAPNGIDNKKEYNGHLDGENQTLKGEDLALYLEQLKDDPSFANELSPILIALKQEIMEEISAEKILTLAPQVLNETLKSVTTDMGKGKLLDLGLSVLMNPVTSVEQIDVTAANQKGDLEKVTKMFEDKQVQY